MNIETSTDKPIVNIPQRKLFDVCLELNKLTFPISRRDDALFYIRPDMCIKQQDFDAVLGEDSRPWSGQWQKELESGVVMGGLRSILDELVYVPTEADLFKQTHGTVNQLVETLTAGWFAYTNVRSGDEFSDFIKGNGATPWFALTDAWIQVQKLKTQNDLKANDIPDADIRAKSI